MDLVTWIELWLKKKNFFLNLHWAHGKKWFLLSILQLKKAHDDRSLNENVQCATNWEMRLRRWCNSDLINNIPNRSKE